jgi:hypothetical protein
MPVSGYDDRFAAALLGDVRHIYAQGLERKLDLRALPVLAELAETVSAAPNNGEADYYCVAVEATLHRAIARIGPDERISQGKRPLRGTSQKERQSCITELLGIGESPGGNIGRRLEDAASALGFTSGRSLQNNKRDGRYLLDLFFDDLVSQLIGLADEHSFACLALESWSTFYPDRPVYDYNGLTWGQGRHGAIDRRPVFNSFINTPSYGDERTFFDGRRADQSPNTNYDPIRDVTHGSKMTVLRAYVDNMAYVFSDDPYCSTAYGTRVRMYLPTATATALRARAYIWADNADMVEDTVDLIGEEPFRVKYIPGSAELRRNNLKYELSDSIVENDGALIGHSVMDGIFPAGNQFEYVALVQIMVRIITD